MADDGTIKVWDPFIRVFHWLLVAGFFTAYLTGDELFGLHVWAGYLVFSLVVLRLAWGFIGTPHARFRDFVRGPGATLDYLKSVVRFRAGERYLGHNPAGGAMIIALLFSLLATAVTGMVTFGAEHTGPLGQLAAGLGFVGEAGEHAVKEIHEFFANLTLALVFVHVAGVALGSLVHQENLVRAMFTGRKRA